MIDTLNIGKYIYNTLNDADTITCNVYPLIADNDAKFPFILYKRVNLISDANKDGTNEDAVTVEISVVTDKYSVGIDLASKVRNLLEKQCTLYQGIEINDTRLVYANEEYNNAFVQRLQFEMKINRLN